MTNTIEIPNQQILDANLENLQGVKKLAGALDLLNYLNNTPIIGKLLNILQKNPIITQYGTKFHIAYDNKDYFITENNLKTICEAITNAKTLTLKEGELTNEEGKQIKFATFVANKDKMVYNDSIKVLATEVLKKEEELEPLA